MRLSCLAAALSLAALSGCSVSPGAPPNAAVPAAVAAPTAPPVARERLTAIVDSPDRTAADRSNDQRRHPVDLLGFIGLRAGWTALDVSTGGGYTTELLARAIGPTGVVYAQAPVRKPDAAAAPRPAAPEGGAPARAPAASVPARRSTDQVLAERAARMRTAGVEAAPIVYVGQPFDDPVPPALADGRIDLVTLMFNYHDFGWSGVDRGATNRAIFRALKPGGLYVIADHAGRPGTGISEAGTLHRIEESFLRAEVEAAGFRLAEEGQFLRNPNDPRDRNNPEPPQPKDEFVLKFVKP